MKIQVISCADLAVAIEVRTALRYRKWSENEQMKECRNSTLFHSRPSSDTYQGLTEGLVLFIRPVKNGRGGVDEQVIVDELGLREQFAGRSPINRCQIRAVSYEGNNEFDQKYHYHSSVATVSLPTPG